jgi:hypothetical protein
VNKIQPAQEQTFVRVVCALHAQSPEAMTTVKVKLAFLGSAKLKLRVQWANVIKLRAVTNLVNLVLNTPKTAKKATARPALIATLYQLNVEAKIVLQA